VPSKVAGAAAGADIFRKSDLPGGAAWP